MSESSVCKCDDCNCDECECNDECEIEECSSNSVCSIYNCELCIQESTPNNNSDSSETDSSETITKKLLNSDQTSENKEEYNFIDSLGEYSLSLEPLFLASLLVILSLGIYKLVSCF